MVGIFRPIGGLYRSKGAHMRDNALLHRLQAGDERAVSELVDTYGQRIYQLAFRYLRNRQDAEEVTQDVLFEVYRKVGAFRGDSALSSSIYRITFNTAMSRLRTAKHQPLPSDETVTREGNRPVKREPADWSDLADEQVLRAEARRHPDARGPRPPGHLPGARHVSRSAGPLDRRGERQAAGQGSDALVCVASRPPDTPPPSARGSLRGGLELHRAA